MGKCYPGASRKVPPLHHHYHQVVVKTICYSFLPKMSLQGIDRSPPCRGPAPNRLSHGFHSECNHERQMDFFQGGPLGDFSTIFPGEGAKVVKFELSHSKLEKLIFYWNFQNPGGGLRPHAPPSDAHECNSSHQKTWPHCSLYVKNNPAPLGFIAFWIGKNAFSSAFCKRTN